ncbi:hypothetical protein FQA47_019445 [Oryzias melastigma]|uniref:Uncharacterized protein n=1 Tax=Oryzias melastigma TaxID=30732 RepID=A0A834F523_ORYME|nr:hypothetical protein FQA47_019445 [Oryzias melastigma]
MPSPSAVEAARFSSSQTAASVTANLVAAVTGQLDELWFGGCFGRGSNIYHPFLGLMMLKKKKSLIVWPNMGTPSPALTAHGDLKHKLISASNLACFYAAFSLYEKRKFYKAQHP